MSSTIETPSTIEMPSIIEIPSTIETSSTLKMTSTLEMPSTLETCSELKFFEFGEKSLFGTGTFPTIGRHTTSRGRQHLVLHLPATIGRISNRFVFSRMRHLRQQLPIAHLPAFQPLLSPHHVIAKSSTMQSRTHRCDAIVSNSSSRVLFSHLR